MMATAVLRGQSTVFSGSQHLARRRVLTILMGWVPGDNVCHSDALILERERKTVRGPRRVP